MPAQPGSSRERAAFRQCSQSPGVAMSSTFPLFEQLSTAMADAVSAAAPGVLAIQTRHARASGFIWRPGWVVSSEEGLPEDEEAELVLPGGTTVAAKVAGRDPTTDVLLLRCEGV